MKEMKKKRNNCRDCGAFVDASLANIQLARDEKLRCPDCYGRYLKRIYKNYPINEKPLWAMEPWELVDDWHPRVW